MGISDVNATFVETLPQEILAAIPAGLPPAGVTPNFANPPDNVAEILGIPYAFFAVAVLTYGLRIYTKARISRNWQWDDLTISLGLLCAIVYNVSVTVSALHGSTGRHAWDLHLTDMLRRSSLLPGMITGLILTPTLGLIKTSFFIQYYVLFKSLRWVRIGVWLGATVSVIFYITTSIVAFVLTAPRPGETIFETFLSERYHQGMLFSIPVGIVGMLVDWYLLFLPVPAVLGLAMSNMKKLGVLLIFMSGAVAAISSIVTLYYRVKLQLDPSDPTWKQGYLAIWAQVEMFAGVTASNMPSVKHFFLHHKPGLLRFKDSLTDSTLWGTSLGKSSGGQKYYESMVGSKSSDHWDGSATTKQGSTVTQSSIDMPIYGRGTQIQVTQEVDVRSVDHHMLASMPSHTRSASWLDLREK